MPRITSDGTPINAVTVTTTSKAFKPDAYINLSFHFLATAITNGNGVFTIDGSNDGINWITGLAFQDPTATASATWVTSKTLNQAGTSSAGAYLPPSGFAFLRIKVTVTTDGTYSAFVNGCRFV